MRVEEPVEVGARERGDGAVFERARLRGARYAVEQGELAEQRAGGISATRPVIGSPWRQMRTRPRKHYVQRLALLALVEDDLARQVFPLVQQAVDDAQLARAQGREETQLPDLREPRMFRLLVLQEAEHGTVLPDGAAVRPRARLSHAAAG